MIGARRGSGFGMWDGLVGEAADGARRLTDGAISPTSLEAYAECGYRYFCSQVLRLRSVKEPEEREMMEAHARGSLAHDVLERFFREMQASGRPREGERWTDADRNTLLQMLDDELAAARDRGLLGLEIFTGHERATLQADLAEFLEQDSDYRVRTGAIPAQFEQPIPPTEVAGVRLRGIVDRIDRSADGRRAWVMDYKTGSTFGFDKIKPDDPLLGGTKLQLPTYLLAVSDADAMEAFYWFISQKGGFERISYAPSAENTRRFEATVEAITTGIERGVFPAVPGEFNEFFNRFDNCGYCDFDRICARRREEAFFDKQGDD
jgi:CRISPR/Cas system-associated exonuclease Cas4 (RecB family)